MTTRNVLSVGTNSPSGLLDIDGHLVVKESGLVGIGRSDPQAKLHVQGDIAVPLNFSIFAPGYTTTKILRNEFTDTLDTLQLQAAGSSGSQIIFRTGSSGGDLRSERMRIINNGNVGIGVTNPESKLQVGARVDNVYANNPLNENVVSIFGPGCTPSIGGISDMNGTLFINSTNSYVAGTGASIAIGGRSTSFGGGQQHMTYGRISGIPGDGYRGNLVLETTFDGAMYERLRIDHNGRVGIGIADPQTPLHVEGSVQNQFNGTTTGFFFYDSTSFNRLDAGLRSITIRASNYIWSAGGVAGGFVHSSDRRIKKDIRDVNDNTALTQLRAIQPRIYKYADPIQGDSDVIGFIAQEVAEVFPMAVLKTNNVVPNIMRKGSVTGSTVTLSDHGLSESRKLKLFFSSGKEGEYVVKTIISPDEFEIDFFVEDSEEVFVYGYEVEDFHTLKKDYLFTINFAATQELDRKVQTLEVENQALKTELSDLKEILRSKGLI